MGDAKDRALRAKQAEAERHEDEIWDAAHEPKFVQLAAWNLHEMERDFSERMLRDGLDVDAVVSLLLAMRHHHDPLYVGFSEGEIAEVRSTVDVAWAYVTGLLDSFREDDG